MIPGPDLDHVTGLECLVCGAVYKPADIEYVCPRHGPVGTLDVRYDYDLVAARFASAPAVPSMWRYRAFVPVHPDAEVPPLRIGGTPLYATPDLAAQAGVNELWVKDEGLQPTASLKDRASAVAVMKAAERNAATVTTASTGNAAAALSGVCAAARMRNVIFVPSSAPEAKIAQLLAFGSEVMLIDGTYDQAFDLCVAAADRWGWYNRNTGFNPYMTEGKKTVMLEIWEQLGRRLPDVVVVSVGDGCIIGGVNKALRDLRAIGAIDHVPRLLGVQAEGSSYLVQAWEAGVDVLTKPPAPADTVADSISAGLPRDRIKALAAVVETGGAFVAVSDKHILGAIPVMAAEAGIFAEPAAAAAFAGLQEAVRRGLVNAGERVVVLSTGSGLKDIAAVRRGVEDAGRSPHRVPPDIDAIATIIEQERYAT